MAAGALEGLAAPALPSSIGNVKGSQIAIKTICYTTSQTINGRMIMKNGDVVPLQHITEGTAYTPKTTTKDISSPPEAIILEPITDMQRGGLLVRITARIDGLDVAVLFEGYLYDGRMAGWPYSGMDLHDGGRIYEDDSNDPAAGAGTWTYTFESNTRWKIGGVRFTYAADANAANRYVTLNLVDPTSAYDVHISPPTAAITANQSILMVFANYGALFTPMNLGAVAGEIYNNMHIYEGQGAYKLDLDITGGQAGDDISAAKIRIEEWVTF